MKRRNLLKYAVIPFLPMKLEGSEQPDHIQFNIYYEDRKIGRKTARVRELSFPSCCTVEIEDSLEGATYKWQSIDVNRDILKISYQDWASAPIKDLNSHPNKVVNGYMFKLCTILREV